MSEQTLDRPSAFTIFKNRNFLLIFSAMFISEFGTGITAIAASILVYRETGSALSVGLMLMATSLPGLLFGLIAGVFVDRVNRKHILIVTELIAGVLILLIPILLPHGIAWLYILVALKSIAYQFFGPALNSALPDITSDEELAAANSLISAAQTGATGLGFAVAGFITSRLTPEWAFYIDSLTFFASATLIAFVTIPELTMKIESSVASVFNNLREGARFLFNSPALRSVIMVTFPMGIIFGLWNSAMLPFAMKALNATEFEYSLIEGIGLVGFMLGSLMMTIIGDRLRESQWLALSFITMGITSAIISQLTSVPLVIVFNLLTLFLNVPSFVARSLIIQRNTTSDIRGRVSSAYYVTRDLSFVIGMSLVGIADVFDIRLVMLVIAVLLIVVGVIALFLPGFRRSFSEWSQSLALLRGVAEAPGLEVGRSVTFADIERFAYLFPVIAELSQEERQRILSGITSTEALAGTVIVRQGEVNDNCYFILAGHIVVGVKDVNGERVVNMLNPGDFFGEIAALLKTPRTANVVAKDTVHLLRVPASTLREMMKNQQVNRVFYSKMMERMMTLNMVDLPRVGGIDQNAARDMRKTETVEMIAAMT